MRGGSRCQRWRQSGRRSGSVEEFLEVFDVFDGVSEDFDFRHSLVGIGTGPSLQGLIRLVHLPQPTTFSECGCLASVNGHRLLLTGLTRPQQTVTVRTVRLRPGSQDVLLLLLSG